MASLHAENLAERLERAAREQHIRQPGDTFGQAGWTGPPLARPPAERVDTRAFLIRLLFLAAVALVCTLVALAIGAHTA